MQHVSQIAKIMVSQNNKEYSDLMLVLRCFFLFGN